VGVVVKKGIMKVQLNKGNLYIPSELRKPLGVSRNGTIKVYFKVKEGKLYLVLTSLEGRLAEFFEEEEEKEESKTIKRVKAYAVYCESCGKPIAAYLSKEEIEKYSSILKSCGFCDRYICVECTLNLEGFNICRLCMDGKSFDEIKEMVKKQREKVFVNFSTTTTG
jgi:bifunctional DNA-binding transcriptional regulator/antitoxin component of YhaV-PrlF toxin-antitoxin module